MTYFPQESNPNILRMDALSIDYGSRLRAAQNSRTPARALNHIVDTEADLERDTSEIFLAIAENPSADDWALFILASDPLWQVREAVARHRNSGPRTLEILAEDMEESIRRVLAEDERTPARCLEILSYDAAAKVRSLVAANEGTPFVVLTELLEDPSTPVRNALKRNPEYEPLIRSTALELNRDLEEADFATMEYAVLSLMSIPA